MPGLDPGIHDFLVATKTWMAGMNPAMTEQDAATPTISPRIAYAPAVEPHDCAGPAVPDVTMFGSLSRPGEPRLPLLLISPVKQPRCDRLHRSSWPGLTRPSTSLSQTGRKTWMPGSGPGMTSSVCLNTSPPATPPHPRDTLRPGCPSPSPKEGVGNAGRPTRPQPRV